jgi:hypothetical protein
LTKQTQQFKKIVKDRLFYNRFEYAIGFTIAEASALRDLSHEKIDLAIERRKEWREISQQRWSRTNSIFSIGQHKIPIGNPRKEITNITVENLHALANTLLTTISDYKLVVSVNQGHVYTNDLMLITQLGNLNGLERKSYSRADKARPTNTIQLKKPQHAFRSYFKITKLTTEQKTQLTGFLLNQPSIRLGPALNEWIDGSFTRTQDYFFIDHDNMSWLTMLSLVRPGLIRKTQQIILAK